MQQLNQFSLLVTTSNSAKGATKSRAQRKREQRIMKDKERENGTLNNRVFSTDQQIDILTMNINKKRLEHEKNETLLVGLSIEKAVLSPQLESAEARAAVRCPKYNRNNSYWQRIDELIHTHDDLVKTTSEKNGCIVLQ
jgi:hypothetical protein